jgi:CubicO group peptidase (beta-lactamase class C family)
MPDIAIKRPEDVGLSSSRLARVDAWREAWVKSGKLAGATTLVMRRGQVAHLGCSGLADIERGLPMAPDSILRIYSMTKPLTSVAIMMLYEEGRFQLDDPSRASCRASGICGSSPAAAGAVMRRCRRSARSPSGTC